MNPQQAGLGTVHHTGDGRAELRFERILEHPPDRVWRAITEPEQLRAWGFPADVEFDPRPGGSVRFGVTDDQRTRFGLTDADASRGVILRIDPPWLLEYTWGEEVLRWELATRGDDACVLVFTNILDTRDIAEQAAAGWHAGLEALERYVDGRDLDVDTFARAADLQPQYSRLVGAATSGESMAEKLHTENGRHVLQIERRFAHPPEKVWRAITEPVQLSRWFPATVEFDLVVGAEVRFDMTGSASPEPDGTITVVDPPATFAFTWSGEVLRWELRPDGDGCVLVFSHTFDDRPGAASFCSGWSMCLEAMRAVVSGAAVSHEPPSAHLHDHYVERFGLDSPVLNARPEGWEVRVERQLTRPAEDVWAHLSAPDDISLGAVVRREEPRMLACEWHHDGRPAGLVRWELGTGTGHGARLVVTQTGPASLAVERDAAARLWPVWVAGLAADIRLPTSLGTA